MSANPSPELILTQLAHILASSSFQSGSRPSAFLEHVVHKAVEGRQNEIKESTIGTEVFGREPGYDTKLDPVVRSVARIVREKLNDYYLTNRPGDWVRIDLPKGSYVPGFRGLAEPPSGVVRKPRVLPRVSSRAIAAALVLSFGGVFGIWSITTMARASRIDGRIPANLIDDAPALYRLGQQKSWRGDHAEALPLLRRASSLRPEDAAIHRQLADDLRVLGYAAAAAAEARQAIQQKEAGSQLDIEASYLAATGEHESALAAYTQLAAMHPHDLRYTRSLAQAQTDAFQYDGCLQTIRRSRAAGDPQAAEDPQLWLQEAFCVAATGDYRLALEPDRRASTLARAQGVRGVYARARLLESGLLMSTGHIRQAQPIREEACQICRQIGDEPCVLRALRVQANQNVVANPKQSLQDYQSACQLARKIGAAAEIIQLLNGEGYAFMALEDWGAANRAFTEALLEARNAAYSSTGIRCNLAEIELRQGQLSRAASEAEEVAVEAHGIGNADTEVAARLILAQALLKQGDWAGAQAEVSRCEALAAHTDLPDLSRSHLLLVTARLQRARGQYRTAAVLLQAARRFSEDWPHDWDLRLEQTEVLVDLGQPGEAARDARELLSHLDEGGPPSAKARLVSILSNGGTKLSAR